MRINQVKHDFNLDNEIQQEMFSLIKRLAFCEPFELEGLKVRANRLIENTSISTKI